MEGKFGKLLNFFLQNFIGNQCIFQQKVENQNFVFFSPSTCFFTIPPLFFTCFHLATEKRGKGGKTDGKNPQIETFLCYLPLSKNKNHTENFKRNKKCPWKFSFKNNFSLKIYSNMCTGWFEDFYYFIDIHKVILCSTKIL